MKFFLSLLLLTAFSIALSAQKIAEVTVGEQIWMSKNLDVDKFRNGAIIPQAKTNAEWKKADESKKPAWCYYNNNKQIGDVCGKLYNWYAVIDPRGICPSGWHVPSDRELEYLRSMNLDEIKSKTGWKSVSTRSAAEMGLPISDKSGTNSSGLNFSPCGNRNFDGSFDNIEVRSYHWSNVRYYSNPDKTLVLNILFNIDVHPIDNYNGFSVRCLKDLPKNILPITSSDKFRTVVIGKQVWMADNLRVDTFRNGDKIKFIQNVGDLSKVKDIEPVCVTNNFKTENQLIYGKLYNYFAVIDQRGLCPTGWHVPSHADWDQLFKTVGIELKKNSPSAPRLMRKSFWKDAQGDGDIGTDEFGFGAVPAGYFSGDYKFLEIGKQALWYSYSNYGLPSYFMLSNNYCDLGAYLGPGAMLSVRCVKD